MQNITQTMTTMSSGSASYVNGYKYGYLNEQNEIVYFVKPLRIERKVGKRTLYTYSNNPTEAQLNNAGYYKVVNVAEDGTDYYNEADNCIYHYIGAPEPIEEPEPETPNE